jgi:hypothetical protein
VTVKVRARRTLVKSAPELWELADDVARMEAWMAGLVGSPQPVPVEVTERRPEQALAWRSTVPGVPARLAIELAEKGFGTAVSITARDADHGDPSVALERLLDELASPTRRPFTAC